LDGSIGHKFDRPTVNFDLDGPIGHQFDRPTVNFPYAYSSSIRSFIFHTPMRCRFGRLSSSMSMSLSNTRSNEDGTNGHDDVDGAIDKMDVAEDSQQQSKESSQSSGFGDIDYDSFFKKVDGLVEERLVSEKQIVTPDAKRPFSSLDGGETPVWKVPKCSLFEGGCSDSGSSGVSRWKSGTTSDDAIDVVDGHGSGNVCGGNACGGNVGGHGGKNVRTGKSVEDAIFVDDSDGIDDDDDNGDRKPAAVVKSKPDGKVIDIDSDYNEEDVLSVADRKPAVKVKIEPPDDDGDRKPAAMVTSNPDGKIAGIDSDAYQEDVSSVADRKPAVKVKIEPPDDNDIMGTLIIIKNLLCSENSGIRRRVMVGWTGG
jgi:hypothetical protein